MMKSQRSDIERDTLGAEELKKKINNTLQQMNLYCDKCYGYIKKSDNIKMIHKTSKKLIYELDYILRGLYLKQIEKIIPTNKLKQ